MNISLAMTIQLIRFNTKNALRVKCSWKNKKLKKIIIAYLHINDNEIDSLSHVIIFSLWPILISSGKFIVLIHVEYKVYVKSISTKFHRC